MNLTIENALLTFDEDSTTVKIEGALRLSGVKEYRDEGFFDFLNNVTQVKPELLQLDLTKLQYLNSSGITAFSIFILELKKGIKTPIVVIGDDDVAWQKKTLPNFPKLWDQVTLKFV